MQIRCKRIYETPSDADGERILVDRLWPRGISKEDASLDAWMRDIAPSTELRRWFDHNPNKWPEFRIRYLAELEQHCDTLRDLAERAAGSQRITLLYAARDEVHNNAVVIEQYLASRSA